MRIRVFIFEDNPDIRETLGEICRSMGYETYAFADPTELRLKFGTSRDRKDLILTDIVMPMMTGIELTEKLITSGFDMENIAIMSGHWCDDDIDYANRLGIRKFSKPFPISALIAWLKQRECQTDAEWVVLDYPESP